MEISLSTGTTPPDKDVVWLDDLAAGLGTRMWLVVALLTLPVDAKARSLCRSRAGVASARPLLDESYSILDPSLDPYNLVGAVGLILPSLAQLLRSARAAVNADGNCIVVSRSLRARLPRVTREL